VLLAGAGLGLWPSARRLRARKPLRVLDERAFSVLAAVAARTVGAPNADAVEIAHRVDATLAFAPAEVGRDVGRLLLLFDNALAGLLFDGRARPFTRLSPEGQDAVLAAWRDSRILVRHFGYTALRKLTQAAHYSMPEAWASVGYPGPPQIAAPVKP
jgi:hypothetical protein